jgi:hypothetical protein
VRKKIQFEPLRAPSTQSLNGFLGVLRVLGGKKSSPFGFSDKLLATDIIRIRRRNGAILSVRNIASPVKVLH